MIHTIGYPGDQQAENGTALTYSSGHLVEMMGTTVKSNVVVSGGASGSPLLSKLNLKVIGIISNSIVTGNDGAYDGTLARPVQSIEKNYQISQYLTGEKQKRVDKIIQNIKASSNPEEAQRWMDAFKAENTLYGISKVEEALFSNASPGVRKAIIQGLQKQGIVRGALGE